MEQVHALTYVGGLLVGRLLERLAHIEVDGLEFSDSLISQLVGEGVERRGALTLARPDRSALVVVIGHHRQVTVTFSGVGGVHHLL